MDSLHCPPSYAPSVHGSRPLCSSQLLLAAPLIAGLLPAQVPSSQPVSPVIAEPEPQPSADAESLLFAGFAQLPPTQQEAARAAAEVLLKATCRYLLQDMKLPQFLNSNRTFVQAMLHLNGKALPPDQELIRAERKQSAGEKLRLDIADTDLKLARLIIQQFVSDSKLKRGRHE